MRHPATFFLFYVLAITPTYFLPYLGSNSLVVSGVLSSTPFRLHLLFLYSAAVIAWFRGRITAQHSLAAYPVIAGLFDLAPGLNWIPLIPTAFHVTTLLKGVRQDAQADEKIGRTRIIVAAFGFLFFLAVGMSGAPQTYASHQDARVDVGQTPTGLSNSRPDAPLQEHPPLAVSGLTTPANASTEITDARWEGTNKHLSDVYQSLLELLPENQGMELRESERMWIVERNKSCGVDTKNPCSLQWIEKRGELLTSQNSKLTYYLDSSVVGKCHDTSIKKSGYRFDGIQDSGSAVRYNDGRNMVDYSVSMAVLGWKAGDPIRLCVVSLPQNCPPGDYRGSTYRATNLRTGTVWETANSQHSCGGA